MGATVCASYKHHSCPNSSAPTGDETILDTTSAMPPRQSLPFELNKESVLDSTLPETKSVLDVRLDRIKRTNEVHDERQIIEFESCQGYGLTYFSKGPKAETNWRGGHEQATKTAKKARLEARAHLIDPGSDRDPVSLKDLSRKLSIISGRHQ